jgi:hypothetical protein
MKCRHCNGTGLVVHPSDLALWRSLDRETQRDEGIPIPDTNCAHCEGTGEVCGWEKTKGDKE